MISSMSMHTCHPFHKQCKVMLALAFVPGNLGENLTDNKTLCTSFFPTLALLKAASRLQANHKPMLMYLQLRASLPKYRPRAKHGQEYMKPRRGLHCKCKKHSRRQKKLPSHIKGRRTRRGHLQIAADKTRRRDIGLHWTLGRHSIPYWPPTRGSRMGRCIGTASYNFRLDKKAHDGQLRVDERLQTNMSHFLRDHLGCGVTLVPARTPCDTGPKFYRSSLRNP